MDSWRELAIIGEVALAMLFGGLIGTLIALRGLKIVHVWIDRRRERQEP